MKNWGVTVDTEQNGKILVGVGTVNWRIPLILPVIATLNVCTVL